MQYSQFNSTHKVETQSFLKCLTFCLFPEDVHVASRTTRLHKLLFLRLAESFEVCNYLSIKFAVLRRQRKRKSGETLPWPAKRFRKFRLEFKWKSPFRFLPSGIFGITSILGSRGYFFLIDTAGSRRSRVNHRPPKLSL